MLSSMPPLGPFTAWHRLSLFNTQSLCKNVTSFILKHTVMTVFQVCKLCSCNLLTKTNYVGLDTLLLLCFFLSYRNHSHPDSNPGQIYGVVALFLLQKPPSLGLEPRTLPRSFDISKISSWFQGVNVLSLGQIGGSLLEL
jgi:hypothetical protein